MRLIYSALYYCLLPVILGRMLWRSRKSPAYRQRLAERFGFIGEDRERRGRPGLWVHAVSVGETLAAVPVVEQLISEYPDHRVVLTTTTPTGSERAQRLFGDRVFHVYCPWDLPGAVRRFVRATEPRLLLIMETELWPNMLHQARRAGCHSLLANARLSERSARGYARVGGLTREMLATLDTVAAQSAADGERLVELGLQREKLHITGSIKFDLELGNRLQREVEALRLALGADRRHIVVVASTHPGEDEQVLAAFAMLRQNHPDCLLIIVPRHPERFDDVYRLCVSAQWQVCRRSSGELPGSDDDVLLGDTMGELLTLLGTATIAVIGGSLVEHGGHNALEASAWGVPVVTGPYMFNFTEISDLLTAAGAMIKLADPSELGASLDALLSDEQRRSAMGAAGREVVADNRGARQRLLALIDAAMQG